MSKKFMIKKKINKLFIFINVCLKKIKNVYIVIKSYVFLIDFFVSRDVSLLYKTYVCELTWIMNFFYFLILLKQMKICFFSYCMKIF